MVAMEKEGQMNGHARDRRAPGAHPMHGARRPMVRIVRAAILVGFVIAMLAGSTAAYAVGVQTTGGWYPGSTTVPKASLDPGDGWGITEAYLSSNARTIYESPAYARYDQYVCIVHRVWKYVPAWMNHDGGHWTIVGNSGTQCGWIRAANTSIWDGGYSFPIQTDTLDQKLTVDVVVTWRLANGSLLGSKNYAYNTLADYHCNVPCGYGYEGAIAYLTFTGAGEGTITLPV
jgi:hypothetical protein